MSKIVWDAAGKHQYETGVSRGVLYPMNDAGDNYDKGVAWNGLSSISESPEGAEVSSIYADNQKYLNLISVEDFKGSIEAYTYPDEFAECDGSAEIGTGVSIGQQTRKKFAVCYRTEVGNDLNSEAGYKIHIVYNCLASPSERSYESVNDSPAAITFSWEFSTTPVSVAGFKPTATVIIDSTKMTDAKLKKALAEIEDKLYGTDASTAPEVQATEPTLLMPDEIMAIVKKAEAEE